MSQKEILLQEQLELINHLLILNEFKERLWEVHPNNPEQINVIEEYDSILDDMISIEVQIKEIGKQIEDGLEN
jgi:hypothetical protein